MQSYSFAMMAADRAGVLALAARSFLLNPALPDPAQDLVDRANIYSVGCWHRGWQHQQGSRNLTSSLAGQANCPSSFLRPCWSPFASASKISRQGLQQDLSLHLHAGDKAEKVEEGTLTATPLEEVICAEQGGGQLKFRCSQCPLSALSQSTGRSSSTHKR
jgi:hypothetical protein